jgi:hypothetical protein
MGDKPGSLLLDKKLYSSIISKSSVYVLLRRTMT